MMFYFDWLYGQPDGFEYNYYLRSMIPNPRFSVNSIAYDVNNISELFNGLVHQYQELEHGQELHII
jgi:hypothetical protein